MLDQSFSVDNFRAIFDYENRKGVYLEGKFFPKIAKVTEAIKTKVVNIRELRKAKHTLAPDIFKEQHSRLNEEIRGLQRKKEEMLAKELHSISREIADPSFRVALTKVPIPGSRTAYGMGATPGPYFAIKQLQYNIRRLYKVKQQSRYQIVRQLTGILGDSFPKYVIRSDIEHFYEFISSERLLKTIDKDALLTLPSRKIIRQVLADYQKLPGGPTGLPRGIGISAYLAELYMREFDERIKAHREVVFYARYVDDMVIIFAPEPDSPVALFRPFVEGEATALGLTLNATKTKCYDLTEPQNHELEYLGYKISFGFGAIRVGLGDRRKQKYETRIKRSFDAYKKHAKYDEKRARRLLLKRIKFLTGNTRLKNNKGNVLVGAYFSNSLLSDTVDLKELDRVLKTQSDSISSTPLKNRLDSLSFEQGFAQRRYHSFSAHELSQIAKLWKHEA